MSATQGCQSAHASTRRGGLGSARRHLVGLSGVDKRNLGKVGRRVGIGLPAGKGVDVRGDVCRGQARREAGISADAGAREAGPRDSPLPESSTAARTASIAPAMMPWPLELASEA